MSTVPQRRYFVYVLIRPDGRPFYVGKGTGKRYQHHATEARSGHKCHKCNVIRQIWSQGEEYKVQIVFTTDDEQAALDREREMIALYGRANLCNLTDGGEGLPGLKHTEETKRKIGDGNRGKSGWRKGTATPPEWGKKIADARRGCKMSPERYAKHLESFNKSPTYIYQITSPAGEVFTCTNFHAWCDDHNWSYQSAIKSSHKTGKYRGWSISKTTTPRSPTEEALSKRRSLMSANPPRARWYRVTAPDGNVYEVHNLSAWCRDNNAPYGAITSAAYTGRPCKGWFAIRIDKLITGG